MLTFPRYSLVWRGPYDSSASYSPHDVVEYEGSAWACVSEVSGAAPGEPSQFWEMLASRGYVGPTGPTGEQGTQGPQGDPGETFTGGDIPGPFSVSSPDFVVNEGVGIGASPQAGLHLAKHVDGQIFRGAITYGSGESPASKEPFHLVINHRDDIPVEPDNSSRGIHQTTVGGEHGGAVSGGSMHNFTATMELRRLNGHNEHAAYYASMRDLTANGEPHSEMWISDFKAHSSREQGGLFGGLTVFLNQYYSGEPSTGPSYGMSISTNAGNGGAQVFPEYDGLPNYPINRGLYIGGRSGTDNAGAGFDIGIRVGGTMHPWNRGETGRVNRGMQMSNYRQWGILLSAAEPGSGALAMGIARAAGTSVFGDTAKRHGSSIMEVLGNGSGTTPAFVAGTPSTKTIEVRDDGRLGFFGSSGTPQQAGNAKTAGDAWGGNEKLMLQIVYNSMRNYGLLGG